VNEEDCLAITLLRGIHIHKILTFIKNTPTRILFAIKTIEKEKSEI
jgi:hypothetical protein